VSGTTVVASISLDTAVEKYVALRDKVAAIKEAHTAQLKPYAEVMAVLEGVMLDALNTNKVETMKAAGGTFFKSKVTSVTCNAWSQTLDYIRDHEAWELLDPRVNKTAAQAIVDETKQPIPGVVINSTYAVRVRRA
jgi:phage host-nuclease inhibitor protein Gam